MYIYPQLQLNFRRQTSLRLYAFRDYERLFEEEFGVRRGPGARARSSATANARRAGRASSLQAGQCADRSAGVLGHALEELGRVRLRLRRRTEVSARQPGGARRCERAARSRAGHVDDSIGGDVTWRPIDALRTSVDASRNTLVRNDNGLTAYDATLVSWRTTYQFTRFTFVRLRTDWDSASATLRGQYLFGWTPNPGTAIYAGYNDVATIDGFDPSQWRGGAGFRRSGRTVFVKVSYLLRTVL